MMSSENGIRGDAVMSTEDPPLYRYELTRWWSASDSAPQRLATFIMLNPSTADRKKDDATIRRCMGFARAWGLDGIRVVNLYAFRSPKPAVMFDLANLIGTDIVGPKNDHTITETLLTANRSGTPVIVAWGNHGAAERQDWLIREAARARVQLLCLDTTQSGAPKHPHARGKHRIPDGIDPLPWPTAHRP